MAKRAELAGRIERCHQELERLVADVGRLDGVIKLFAPDYKLEGIRAKAAGQRNRFFRQGECQRLVLEIFRDASEPLSAHRIAEVLAQRKGLEATQAVIDQLRKDTLGVVRRLGGKGVVEAARTDGAGNAWSLC